MTTLRRIAFAVAVAVAITLLVATAGPAGAGEVRTWDFQVQLDGQTIGRHRFELLTDGDQRTLVNHAAFTVKLLGIPVYRYRHDTREQWRGDCLTALMADTNDGGERAAVRARGDSSGLQIEAPGGTTAASGCVMSYAYWHPAMLKQSRLLNAQTGAVDAVRISAAGSASIEVQGRPQPATRWVIDGKAGPLAIWVSPQGEWVGLDATVRGTRKLSYRL
ncbi:MAG: DUF6134 family protein, partial [Burkholderiales bacterium]